MIIYQLKLIIVILTLSFLTSCAPDPDYPPEWVKSLETLPKLDGYMVAGVFGLRDNIYLQQCDDHGNSHFMKYDKETTKWYGVKYSTGGCIK